MNFQKSTNNFVKKSFSQLKGKSKCLFWFSWQKKLLKNQENQEIWKTKKKSYPKCVQLTKSFLVHLNVIFSSDCYLITSFSPAVLVYDLVAVVLQNVRGWLCRPRRPGWRFRFWYRNTWTGMNTQHENYLKVFDLISTKKNKPLTWSKKKGQSLEGWTNSARTKVCKRNSVLVGIPELGTSWPRVNWTTLQGGSWLQTAGFTAYFQKSSSSLRPGFTQSACQGETQLLARTYMG